MQIVIIALEIVMTLITVWLSLSYLFQLVISVFGFRKRTKDYQDHAPELRFLVLVPAHNEEAVLGDIIENLKHMEYPRELYDYYILADNCTDGTARIAREMGAKVLEFFKESPDDPTGKSIVLQKAFHRLKDYQKNYDVVMFFDADNLIDSNMFQEVNSQMMTNPEAEIVQCYLGCKNKKGLVALFYYITYAISNRFLQYGRLRLGLNCGIGGTGFAVKTRYLYKRGGWTVMSLTEDTELQFAATLEGRKILWNHHVRVYDEKPVSWKASFRQRVRWAQGHWFVAFKNTGKLFRNLRQKKIPKGEFISMFVQMYFPCTYVFAFLNFVFMMIHYWITVSYTHLSVPSFFTYSMSIITTIPAAILFIYSIFVQFGWADWVDNGIRFSVRSIIPILLSFFINSLLAGLAQIVGLLKYKQQGTWVKTEHSITRDEGCSLQPDSRPPEMMNLVVGQNEKPA